jgi:hypothetical protein
LLIALQAARSDFRTSCTSHYHLPHSGAVPFTPYVFLPVAPMSMSFTNSFFQPCPRVRTCQPRNPSWSSLDGSARRPAACTSTLLLTQSSLLTLCSTACFLPLSLVSTSSEPALHRPQYHRSTRERDTDAGASRDGSHLPARISAACLARALSL